MVNDTRKVKIYTLKHPDTLEIRYVGKTVRSLSRRLGNHIANAKGNKHNKHLSNWILKILSEGKRPIIEQIEECTPDIWQEREQYWISQFPNLINLTDGGDGCVGFIHDQATRERLSLINRGRRHTQAFKDAMSKRLKGVKHSEEHIAKIAAANRGRKATLETRKKLSESHKGIIQSEESRRKRSETIKAWWAKRKSVEDIVES
jgi:group I intron endonuclease